MPVPSLTAFPPPPASTALLHLLAHSAVHPEKSDADTEARLDRPGLFLIRTLPSSSALLLSVRVEKSVADFELTVEEDLSLSLSSHRFASLDDLIGHAIKVGFAYRGEILRMERCLPREHARSVPLGHWEHARLVPRACRKGLSEDGRLPCSLLAPSAKISRALSDEELEELVKMKHDALLHLDDYTRLCSDAAADAALLLKFARFEIPLGAYLRAHDSTSIVQRLAWLTKTVSALSFLMDRDPSVSVLLTGETLVLQDTDSLQLKLVHLGTEVDAKEHWRYMAPETHSSPSSPSSLAWQLAVLIWQTFTDFALLPMESFLMSTCLLLSGRSLTPRTVCPFLVLPHSLTVAEAAGPVMRRHQPNYGAMARFAAAPASVNALFSACLIFSPPDARATWSRIERTLEAEYKTARLAKIIDKFIP